MKEGKTIRVRPGFTPVVGRVPVEHYASREPDDSATVQKEKITLTPSAPSGPSDGPSLQDWADYFAPSIERLLPSSDDSFTPEAVSIERETFYRDEEQDAQDEHSKPRRVRVTRRRVTLFGSARQARP